MEFSTVCKVSKNMKAYPSLLAGVITDICLRGCYCPLESCRLLSLYSGSSVPCQCWNHTWNRLPISVSAIVESHEHPGNNTLIICNKKPRFHILLWLSRESFGHLWLYPLVHGTYSCCWFCLSVNNWSTNFTNCTVIHFKPYCRTVMFP